MVFYYLHKKSMEVLGFLMSLWFGRISHSGDGNCQSSGSRRAACAHLRLGFAFFSWPFHFPTFWIKGEKRQVTNLFELWHLPFTLFDPGFRRDDPGLSSSPIDSLHPFFLRFHLFDSRKKERPKKKDSFGLAASYETETCAVPTRFLWSGDRLKSELTIEKELSKKKSHISLRACVYLGPDPLQLP